MEQLLSASMAVVELVVVLVPEEQMMALLVD